MSDLLDPPIQQQQRRISRSSFQWFQNETRRASQQKRTSVISPPLIGKDGKLSDDYILRRQSVNRPATLSKIPLLADLATSSSTLTHIDGWILTQLFLSGYAKLQSRIDNLNKINVFPYADGDTGANMNVCLKLPTRNLVLFPSEDVVTVCGNLAADVLLNGQGNSGTILSHWFVSLAEEVTRVMMGGVDGMDGMDGRKETLSIDEFARCLTRTGAKMNDAVPNPMEGTLLSVSRDACRLVEDEEESDETQFANLKDLIEAWNSKTQEELAKTPEKLVVNGVKVLEKAGVVDSGAQGFAYFVEGMYLACLGQLPEATNPDLFRSNKGIANDDSFNMKVDHNVCDSSFQYCTEAVILLKDGSSKSDILDRIETSMTEDGAVLGDSIACVHASAKEGGSMAKLHIHTNKPQRVFDCIRPLSRDVELKKEKVEDMFFMKEDYHENHYNKSDLSDAKFTIAGLCSIVLPPQDKSDDLVTFPVFVVPSTTQEPIDVRYTTDTDYILAMNAQRHKSTAIGYSTAASNPMQIKIELLAALAKEKPVLVFIFSMTLSVLGNNIMEAIGMLEPDQRRQIKVLNHGWFFEEAGILREAIECAKKGKTIEEAFEACKEVADRSLVFQRIVTGPTISTICAWRPSLFPNDFEVAESQYYLMGVDPKLRDGPILTDEERAVKAYGYLGKAPTFVEAQDLLVQQVRNALRPGQAIANLIVACCGRPDFGKDLVEKMKKAEIPLIGEPTIHIAGFMSVKTGRWGEIAILYKIVYRS